MSGLPPWPRRTPLPDFARIRAACRAHKARLKEQARLKAWADEYLPEEEEE